MNALKLIKTDHDRLKAMLEEAVDTNDPRRRSELLHHMRTDLVAHEEMEEEVFYPALRSDAKARDIVLERYEEHHVIDLILDEMFDVPEDDGDQWKAKMKVLKENIEHHIEQEEGETFKKARQALSEETLEDLGRKMQSVKDASTA